MNGLLLSYRPLGAPAHVNEFVVVKLALLNNVVNGGAVFAVLRLAGERARPSGHNKNENARPRADAIEFARFGASLKSPEGQVCTAVEARRKIK
jgi:hypothetical protein